jgi:CBS-domain-containing membrane protein
MIKLTVGLLAMATLLGGASRAQSDFYDDGEHFLHKDQQEETQRHTADIQCIVVIPREMVKAKVKSATPDELEVGIVHMTGVPHITSMTGPCGIVIQADMAKDKKHHGEKE